MYMVLYSDKEGPFVAVNRVFEETFLPVGRMRELNGGGEGGYLGKDWLGMTGGCRDGERVCG